MIRLIFSTFIILVLSSSNFSQDDGSGIKPKTTAPNKNKSRTPTPVKKKSAAKKDSSESATKKSNPKTKKTLTASLELTVTQIGSRVEIKRVKNGFENVIQSRVVQQNNEKFSIEGTGSW